MSRQLKAVHITTLHHPLDPRIYYKQCLSLHQAGYDVTLIAPVSEEMEVKPEFSLVPLKKYANRWIGLAAGTFHAYLQAKKLKADVYHFHDPELLLIGRLLKKKDNEVIYDIHEDYETGIIQRNYFTAPVRKAIAKIYKYVEKKCTIQMKLVLAEKYYKEKYPSGTCILNYPLLNPALLHREIKFHTASQVLYTGNITKDRGAVQHAKLPLIDEGISLHLYGKCSKDLAEEMFETAGAAQDRLHIHGIGQYIPKAEIDAAYEKENWLAGIALFPPTEHYMKKELTKFFEYMAAGIPVICSDFPKWKEFIQEYDCGICVDPDNEQEIAEALQYLKSNPEKARQMGENGRRAVKEHLNWKKEEDKLIHLYEELVSK